MEHIDWMDVAQYLYITDEGLGTFQSNLQGL